MSIKVDAGNGPNNEKGIEGTKQTGPDATLNQQRDTGNQTADTNNAAHGKFDFVDALRRKLEVGGPIAEKEITRITTLLTGSLYKADSEPGSLGFKRSFIYNDESGPAPLQSMLASLKLIDRRAGILGERPQFNYNDETGPIRGPGMHVFMDFNPRYEGRFARVANFITSLPDRVKKIFSDIKVLSAGERPKGDDY